MQLRWRKLTDGQREAEYSPSSAIGGDIQPYIDAYAKQSAAERQVCADGGHEIVELRYGPDDANTIDLVTPSEVGDGPCPLLVFIHGGYWQLLSKRESFFAAAACLDQGIAFAALDYTLAPHATLDEIVAECRDAVAVLGDAAETYGYDPQQIYLAGSSAGAHLCAMVTGGASAGSSVAGVILVSGVYELEPLIGTSINDAVGMDVDTARFNSPIRQQLASFPRTLIAYGEIETDEFKRQSLLFDEQLAKAGVATQVMEIADKNHFDVILDLADPETSLGRAVTRFITDDR